ncbi:uncharacterized protein LOC143118536 [Alosa pseudoharengus]|uniref:uncharacterized protein LOC143118536 n=1 Tax=Alosa pseudoharengus TaxID=34774 RepID=UPI003F8BAB8F
MLFTLSAEWDSDMASLLVLLHLLTPQPAGRKRPKKISVREATDHLVKFQKSCQSLEDHLRATEGNPQPYLLASGTSKAQVSSFYIVLDRKLLPCQSCTSLEGMTVYLKHLIIEHHQLFKELYPSKNLIPKHHFMVHYPRCIRQIGPLIHIWTMRFEAKHKFFKDCVKNFKNLTVSLAKKHQFAVAYHWECFSSKAVESGPVKLCLLETLEYIEEEDIEYIAEYLHIDSQATVRLTNWVKCGVEYRVGLFVCTSTDENMPVFSKIISIILHDGKVVFVLVEHETCFHDHFHAFQISENIPRKILVLEMDRLRHFKSFDAQMSYGCDSHLYVVSEGCIL